MAESYVGQESSRVIAKGWLIARSRGWRETGRYVLEILSVYLFFFATGTLLIPLVGLALRVTIEWPWVLLSFGLVALAGLVLIAYEVWLLRRAKWQATVDDVEYARFAALEKPKPWLAAILFVGWVAFLVLQLVHFKL